MLITSLPFVHTARYAIVSELPGILVLISFSFLLLLIGNPTTVNCNMLDLGLFFMFAMVLCLFQSLQCLDNSAVGYCCYACSRACSAWITVQWCIVVMLVAGPAVPE